MREWLRKARLDKALTMKQLANELHISESYYCAIEKGTRQRDMDLSLVEKLSQVLDISLKDILLAESGQRIKCAGE